MSARAWQQRRRAKRFQLAVKRAIEQIKVNPDAVIHLEEFGLAVMSSVRHVTLTGWIDKFGEGSDVRR